MPDCEYNVFDCLILDVVNDDVESWIVMVNVTGLRPSHTAPRVACIYCYKLLCSCQNIK